MQIMQQASYYHLKKRPRTAPPTELARPLALKAFVARFEAWLNLSHLEKAKVLVTVRTIAMTVGRNVSTVLEAWQFACLMHAYGIRHTVFRTLRHRQDSPTKLSQINSNLTIATTPSATQLTGWAYTPSQKNLLSVALICLVSGSALSKTQFESPDCELTSFHQRRPTSLRPAIFFR